MSGSRASNFALHFLFSVWPLRCEASLRQARKKWAQQKVKCKGRKRKQG